MPASDGRERYLIVGTDKSAFEPFLTLQEGRRSLVFVEDIDRMLESAARLTTDRASGLAFDAAVVLTDGMTPDSAEALAPVVRTLVPVDLAVVVASRAPVSAAARYCLMEAGVDSCSERTLRTCPQRVRALIEGTWPGARDLLRTLRRSALSPTQARAVLAACAGLSKVETHELLGCSARTLETHWSHIFTKVGIRSTEGIISAMLRAILNDALLPSAPSSQARDPFSGLGPGPTRASRIPDGRRVGGAPRPPV